MEEDEEGGRRRRRRKRGGMKLAGRVGEKRKRREKELNPRNQKRRRTMKASLRLLCTLDFVSDCS